MKLFVCPIDDYFSVFIHQLKQLGVSLIAAALNFPIVVISNKRAERFVASVFLGFDIFDHFEFFLNVTWKSPCCCKLPKIFFDFVELSKLKLHIKFAVASNSCF